MEHNAIVIGGSAGSFQIALRLLETLRKDLPVPLFLYLHRLKQIRKGFQETLNYNANLRVREPLDKEDIRPGNVYLAPANYHMLKGLLALLLSGANQDGTAGVVRVKQNRGTVIVQDPEDCEIATMCESALRYVQADHVMKVSKIIEFISLFQDAPKRAK